MFCKIRNFCIIAHIDHWKSTLADRMLEITWTVRKIDHNQMLDRMDIEQERGITIKLTPARMQRKWYEFNLIDTPGHVDFWYEVSRSLASVEWAILLIDASQWIQAQTLSVLYQAIDQNLVIIPVLNKIDLPAANPERVAQEIENVLWIDKNEIIKVSWKTWENVEKVLDAIIERIQDPISFKQNNLKKFRTFVNMEKWKDGEWKNVGQKLSNTEFQWSLTRALIFDSVYDPYRGVVCYVKVVDWQIKPWKNINLIHSNKIIQPTEVWHFTPEYKSDESINEWQIWYIVTGEKSVRDTQIWDTIIKIENSDSKINLHDFVLPGFKTVKPFVYAWIYPIDTWEYEKLKDSLEKLSLNDSAIEYTMEDSKALWFGFRCWFLWMLHMDIIKERLEREYKLDTIFTIPTVVYLVKAKLLSLDLIKTWKNTQIMIKSGLFKYVLKENWVDISKDELEWENMTDQEIEDKYYEIIKPWIVVRSGVDMIAQWLIDKILEPIAQVEVVWPKVYAGEIMWLCQEYRGKLLNMDYIDDTRVVRNYELPFGEIIIDFYDRLKSATKGYATMNYEFKKYQESDLVKLDIFINNEQIEALSRIVHNDNSYYKWRDVVEKLKELIPKHLFSIPIQAWIWAKMIARENIPAMKKDVLAKCYGWDVTRKRKLLQKQKEWKKKMKAMWNVNVPSDIFIKMVARSN